MQTRVDPCRVIQAQPNAEQRNLEDNVTAQHCWMRLILLETFGPSWLLLRDQIPFYNYCKFQGICQGYFTQVIVLMEVWMYSAGLRFCQIGFLQSGKRFGHFWNCFLQTSDVLHLVCTVPVDVVVGGFSIRFGSGYLEPMSTTPQPLCFTSHCSSGELARPTCPWPCACGRVGVHGYACVLLAYAFLQGRQQLVIISDTWRENWKGRLLA